MNNIANNVDNFAMRVPSAKHTDKSSESFESKADKQSRYCLRERITHNKEERGSHRHAQLNDKYFEDIMYRTKAKRKKSSKNSKAQKKLKLNSEDNFFDYYMPWMRKVKTDEAIQSNLDSSSYQYSALQAVDFSTQAKSTQHSSPSTSSSKPFS